MKSERGVAGLSPHSSEHQPHTVRLSCSQSPSEPVIKSIYSLKAHRPPSFEPADLDMMIQQQGPETENSVNAIFHGDDDGFESPYDTSVQEFSR